MKTREGLKMLVIKNITKFIAVTALAAGFMTMAASGASAQSTSDAASANATANILGSISLTKVDDLAFGDIIASNQAGTVAVSTNGQATDNGGVIQLGGEDNAEFTVSGQKNRAYDITLPGSIDITGPGNEKMTVDNFVSTPDGSGQIKGNGIDTIKVGATLHINANQAYGFYTGTFDVTVAYQ